MQQKFFLGSIITVLAITIGFTSGKNIVNSYVYVDDAPDQPIKFSHKLHAGDNNIPCRLCHAFAWRSKVSGVPPVKRCYMCHRVEKTDSIEIKKIHKYWNDKKPIPWLKVYDLPDFIYFPHKRHVRAGLKCQNCHGEVQKMVKIKKANDLVMGWCLNCHRNKVFVGKDGKRRSGPKWDCWDCHV